MKKNKNVILTAIAVCLVFFIGLTAKMRERVHLSGMILENVEALTYELEEVTITCGRVDGPCYFQQDLLIEPGNCHDEVYRYECIATGDPNDYCGGVNPKYIQPC